MAVVKNWDLAYLDGKDARDLRRAELLLEHQGPEDALLALAHLAGSYGHDFFMERDLEGSETWKSVATVISNAAAKVAEIMRRLEAGEED